jgi:hypothetical protein
MEKSMLMTPKDPLIISLSDSLELNFIISSVDRVFCPHSLFEIKEHASPPSALENATMFEVYSWKMI